MARADCPVCGGSGWKVVERTTAGVERLGSAESARPDVSSSQPGWAVPCDCTVADRTDRTERVLARARIPERYRECDFETFETEFYYEGVSKDRVDAWNGSLAQAKRTVEWFVREFPVCKDRGLILMGKWGVGKTHLAVAALKAIVLKGHYGLFYDYAELLKLVQSTYDPKTDVREMDVLDPLVKCDLLLLDDLGSSKPSMWALETVGHILTSRYNEGRFSLITTNFLDADSKLRPDFGRVAWSDRPREKDGKEGPPPDSARSRRVLTMPSGELIPTYAEDSLEERIGARIRSRLYEMCITVEIESADRRKIIRTSRT